MDSKSNKRSKKDVRSSHNVKSYSVNRPIEPKPVKEKIYVEIDDSVSKDEMRKQYKSQKHQKLKGKTPQRGGKRVDRFED
ncbi:Uncharacterized protein QTN25_004906 [Entamoeba marina]